MDADALAELAKNRGLKLKRSRVRSPEKPGFGMFGLTDAAGEPVFGIRGKRALRASGEELESYLRGLEQDDWRKSLREAGASVSSGKRKKVREPVAAEIAAPEATPVANLKQPPPPALREAKGKDAEQLAELYALLGHAIAPELVRKNVKALARSGEPVLVIAQGDTVLGTCAYHATPMPHRDPPVGRITVLVLTEEARGKGFGRQLVAEAERRLGKLGCGMVEVTSNDRLREAHAFYRHLGYERTSMRFAKPLGGG
ncbi:GNAT family N-acetyltransferase [Sphingomonas sp. KRR8]|uniref:GNAT family N-acetyltransferase n=1 Tax=Sphingomonas sp. KRR8 TaxID=2942996 RepID=UPI0020209BEB|nr:GNAT family N-acetyltransferase [Sphingomonas sp. KRR8]URD60585.1 GNAT family N-acetyltransferase [Sphingomonas sp. KRR8]